MKTIAISLDDASLAALDRMWQGAGRGKMGKKTANRSQMVRQAVREFIARHCRQEREENDHRILAANRARIEREASALVGKQAVR